MSTKRQTAIRQVLRNKLTKESKLVAKESMEVLSEFEKSENEWWKDKQFVAELDRRYKDMESGKDKGVTLEQLNVSIEKRKYNKQ
jgi:hypothetical protein